MHKGFGLYSPHESTTFFLKALLLSFWVGLDVIAGLLLLNIPALALIEHWFAILVAMTVLFTATTFSLLFVCVTGILFGRTAAEAGSNAFPMWQRIQRQPSQLIYAGVAGSAILIVAFSAFLLYLRHETALQLQIGRADMEMARKCEEVASLEKGLFHSEEQFVMTQCLLQYDRTYAALHQ